MPRSESINPGEPMPTPSTNPSPASASRARTSSAMRSQTTAGPSEARVGVCRDSMIRPVRSISALAILVAPRSTPMAKRFSSPVLFIGASQMHRREVERLLLLELGLILSVAWHVQADADGGVTFRRLQPQRRLDDERVPDRRSKNGRRRAHFPFHAGD